MHALCHPADGGDARGQSAVLVAYFAREKLFADVPFFEVCDELFVVGAARKLTFVSLTRPWLDNRERIPREQFINTHG